MARALVVAIAALASSVFYRIYLQHIVTVLIGVGRVTQPIEDFPYDCTRLQHPQLEACEDIWLDHTGRKLYLACSSIEARSGWFPPGSIFKTPAASRADHISVLNIDNGGADGLYGLHQLDLPDQFVGHLDLHGFDARRVNGRLRFWLVNHKPPLDADGHFMDAASVGANSTIEIFDMDKQGIALEHIRTIHHETIISPNDVAADVDGVGIIVTNDHPTKRGMFRDLSLVTGGSSLTYCDSSTGRCHHVAEKSFYVANGIARARGQSNLYFVSDTGTGTVKIFRLENGQVTLMDKIELGMGLDNISIDADGNAFVAGLPDMMKIVKLVNHPDEGTAPSTVWMIRKNPDKGYEHVKVIEDRDAKYLPTASVVVHDVLTKRLFFSSPSSRFITICKRRT